MYFLVFITFIKRTRNNFISSTCFQCLHIRKGNSGLHWIIFTSNNAKAIKLVNVCLSFNIYFWNIIFPFPWRFSLFSSCLKRLYITVTCWIASVAVCWNSIKFYNEKNVFWWLKHILYTSYSYFTTQPLHMQFFKWHLETDLFLQL